MAPRWYRSLYWRIAIGFVLCLAAMLVVQAFLFVWVVSRAGPTLPGQSPERFAQTVARDLADALDRDPSLDIAAFIKEQFGRDAHPFFVMLPDGRVISNDGPFPEQVLQIARNALQRSERSERQRPQPFDRSPFGRRPFPYDRGGGAPFDRPSRTGPRGDPFRLNRPMPIIVNGDLAGVVVVPPVAPFRYLLGRYAPTLALVAGGALIVGATLTAIAIFGPTRRRLRAVEDAARRLGSGDLSARVPAGGGDEVAAVAAAFNSMAVDLAARADALAASDRVRRQLLADVSHELTTPMTAMRGYLETLKMSELDLDETTRTRYLDIVADETARLERIIRDLLDLARLEGGGGRFVIEPVGVDQLFARVVARHEREAAERGVRLDTMVDAGAELVSGDRDRLEQALQNLAANALRYAPHGSSVELRATVVADGTVTMTVSDEGAGIPAEHLAHVFDRFYKVDSSRAAAAEPSTADAQTMPGGSGLGLSIVKAIVERHGGGVSVASRPGKTTFEIAGLARPHAPTSTHD